MLLQDKRHATGSDIRLPISVFTKPSPPRRWWNGCSPRFRAVGQPRCDWFVNQGMSVTVSIAHGETGSRRVPAETSDRPRAYRARSAGADRSRSRIWASRLRRVAGEPRSGGRASSSDPPTRPSAAAWGEPPWSRTLATGAAATTARGGRAPPGARSTSGGRSPAPSRRRGQKASRGRKAPVQGQLGRAARHVRAQSAKAFARAFARGAASCIAARSEPQASEGKSWRRMTGVQPVKCTVRP